MEIFGKLFGKTKTRNQINGLTAREWHDKGFSLYKEHKFEEALECYEKVLKLNPDNALALSQKGYCLANLGRHEEALACCEKVIEKNPELTRKDDIIWYTKGHSLFNLRRPQESVECFNKALEIKSGTFEKLAWWDKGQALAELNNHEEGLKCFDNALKIDPDFGEAKESRKLCLRYIKPLIGATQIDTYWWMWIPIIGWLPFFLSFLLPLPLGPFVLGFGKRARFNFLDEAYLHSNEIESLGWASGFMNCWTSYFTLGYDVVCRTYKILKKMRGQHQLEEEKGHFKWNPVWLLIYPFCPALVFMPLIKAMDDHWQRHIQRNSFSLLARNDKTMANLDLSDAFRTPFGTKLMIIKGVFTVRFEHPNLEVVREEDGQIFFVKLRNLPEKKQPDLPDFYIEEKGNKIGLYLCTGHQDIFWKSVQSKKKQ